VIIVTGGAGFIGSALIWELNRRGKKEIVVVDRLGTGTKWKNLRGLRFHSFIHKETFLARLEAGEFDDRVDTVIHMGACSATTESDADYLMENNTNYTLSLARWWEGRRGVRFIYASSAATYGDGSNGYDDDESKLDSLRPLNMYGYSKHLFDCIAREQRWLADMVGLKFFNVYGPNENHKGGMRSLINKAYPTVRDTGKISLFRSDHPDYPDGEQVRDFIYVKDAAAMALYFTERRDGGGLFNIGTGEARSWNDVARALFAASKAFAIAESIVKIQQGLANASALPFPANIGAMATVAANTASIVGTIQSTQMQSFDGGGFTGSGPRVGGLDGRGGFMAMLHPNETVIDHTRGGVVASPTVNVYTQGGPVDDRSVQQIQQGVYRAMVRASQRNA